MVTRSRRFQAVVRVSSSRLRLRQISSNLSRVFWKGCGAEVSGVLGRFSFSPPPPPLGGSGVGGRGGPALRACNVRSGWAFILSSEFIIMYRSAPRGEKKKREKNKPKKNQEWWSCTPQPRERGTGEVAGKYPAFLNGVAQNFVFSDRSE